MYWTTLDGITLRSTSLKISEIYMKRSTSHSSPITEWDDSPCKVVSAESVSCYSPLAAFFGEQANNSNLLPAERKRKQNLYERIASGHIKTDLHFHESVCQPKGLWRYYGPWAVDWTWEPDWCLNPWCTRSQTIWSQGLQGLLVRGDRQWASEQQETEKGLQQLL